MIIISQIAGAIALIFWVTSIQHKKQDTILFYQALANAFYTLQYCLLGVFTAASMNFSSVLRCSLFSYKRKNNQDIPVFWLIFFMLLIIILGFVTYDGIISLIPIIITLFYTLSSWLKESKWLRIVFIIAAIIWIYYNFTVHAYISIVGNLLEILSGIISLIRFEKK